MFYRNFSVTSLLVCKCDFLWLEINSYSYDEFCSIQNGNKRIYSMALFSLSLIQVVLKYECLLLFKND